MHYSVEEIAQVCWEHNRALQAVDRESWPDEPWPAAPQWRKDVLIAMVLLVQRKTLRSARDTHEFWKGYMSEEGWQPGEKDPLKKRHPNIRSWEELESWQQLAQEANYDTITKMGAAA